MNHDLSKLLTTLQGFIFFFQLLQTGDRGDKSDSNKYLRALAEGVMPDCCFMLAEILAFTSSVKLGFAGVDVGFYRGG